ncbi:MAG TPA: hypoxanthine phosphoribosyltransferase, partial [Acidimicrobiales bacterium]|nr:hypoxanthine phosphoribosyltransferase [Acidimicrobiales bacterium]
LHRMTDAATPRILFDREQVQAAVQRLADDLSTTYDDGVVLVAVLKGSVLFLADLIRKMTVHPVVDFMSVSSFGDGGPRARILKDLETDVTGRDVVLVEDVIDTGLSLSWLLDELRARGARTLEVCALVDKPGRRIVPVDVRWVGLTVEEPYVCGYGLDVAERYRNIDVIAVADTTELAADPDAYVESLYRRG